MQEAEEKNFTQYRRSAGFRIPQNGSSRSCRRAWPCWWIPDAEGIQPPDADPVLLFRGSHPPAAVVSSAFSSAPAVSSAKVSASIGCFSVGMTRSAPAVSEICTVEREQADRHIRILKIRTFFSFTQTFCHTAARRSVPQSRNLHCAPAHRWWG